MSGTPAHLLQSIERDLGSLPDEYLIAVLREVFGRRAPRAEGEARYFLARTARERDPVTGAWGGEIGHAAVAYPDAAHYGDGHGPDWGLVQSGSCERCRVELVSNCKRVRCPLCDDESYLT